MGGELPSSSHFSLQEVGTGVYAAVATEGGFALSNAGIVDLGDATVIFDTFLHPRARQDLRRAAERLTGRPVAHVVNSHWHGDHIRGNQAFDQVPVVGTTRTRELVLTKGREELLADRETMPELLRQPHAQEFPLPESERKLYEGWLGGVVDALPGLRLREPNLTFDSALVLHGSRRSARILSFGGGHTLSDAFLYLPEDRILFAGDLLFSQFHPYPADGNPEALVEILERIRDLRIDATIPGHGPVGTIREIETMQRYVSSLLRKARELRSSGETKSAATQLTIPDEFGAWKFSRFFPETIGFLFDWNASAPS